MSLFFLLFMGQNVIMCYTIPVTKYCNFIINLVFLLSEFSESLQEMGNCLLEKTAMHDDEESGK